MGQRRGRNETGKRQERGRDEAGTRQERGRNEAETRQEQGRNESTGQKRGRNGAVRRMGVYLLWERCIFEIIQKIRNGLLEPFVRES
jgi:hypothetical protein